MQLEGGLGVTRLREVSRDELLLRRRAVLERLGISYDELASRAEKRGLVGDEWSAWDELQEIDFLVGDDNSGR